jgi:hypothetical protein
MLNDFLPNDLLKEELVKRDYVLSNVEKDDTWVGASSATGNGGNLIVPFKAAGASSVAMGGLSASNDIAEDNYVRGTITTQKEAWGSMIFNHRDLMEHEQVSEKNFLKILPDSINDFMDYMRNVVSVNLLNGAWFATLKADSTANDGAIYPDRPDRFVIAQKVVLQDSLGSVVVGYVQSIDMNAIQPGNVGVGKVVLVTQRNGATVVNFAVSNMTVANTAKAYNDGANVAGAAYSSLRQLMLSAANGGDAQIYGVTKTLYPYTQAININGSSCTQSNFVEKIFDGYTQTRLFGKGAPTDILMSYARFGTVMKIVEASKGAFNVVPNSMKTSQYGWTEISVGSVTSQSLKYVGIQEMDNDIVIYMDWRAAKFYSNGFFRKRKSPDGIEYFEVRATTGFQYIVDVCLFGELVLQRPSYCGIMYGINF